MNFKNIFGGILISIISLGVLNAQEKDLDKAEEIARLLANPSNILGSLNLLTDYSFYNGTLNNANSQQGSTISFQPNLPYPIGNGVNLYVRPLIPFTISRPVYNESSDTFGHKTGLGDISVDVLLGKTWESGLVIMSGGFGKFPTATNSNLGSGQVSLGPNLLLGKASSWGFVGAVVAHSWSINNPDKGKSSVTSGQYLYTIKIKNTWQVSAQPTFSYNHNARKGDKFSFPLGTGIANVYALGKTPVRVRLEYWYFVARPDTFGTEHQLRLVFTPVVPLPWKSKKNN